MATLQKIRSHGTLLLVIVGLAMLAFILGDLFSNRGFFHRNDNVIAKVAGTKITYQDYDQLRIQREDFYKKIWNVNSIPEDYENQIRAEVWQTLKDNALLAKEAKKMGLTVTDAEVAQLFFGENPHPLVASIFQGKEPAEIAAYIQDLNRYKGTQYEGIAAEEQKFLAYIEQTVRESYLKSKYQMLVSGLVSPNKLEEKFMANVAKTNATLEYAFKPYHSVEGVTVTDKEIQARYDKVKANYPQVPTRVLQYAVFEVKPSEADYAKLEHKFDSLMNIFSDVENVASFLNINESAVLYRGLDYSETTVPEEYKEFAFDPETQVGDVKRLEFHNNIFSAARVMENGYSLPDSVEVRYAVVETENIDSLKTAWAENDTLAEGFAQWLPVALQVEDTLYQQFFTTPEGGVFTFADPSNGVELIAKIVTRPEATPKVKMAILQYTLIPSNETDAALYSKASQFITNNNTSAKMIEAGKKTGVAVLSAAVNVESFKVANLPNSRQIVKWAFGEETKKGATSDVYTCGDNYVVALVQDIYEGDYKHLTQIKETLRQEILKEKQGKAIADMLAGAKTVEEAAEKWEVELQTAADQSLITVALEPAAMGATLRLNEGQTTGVVLGETGAYMIHCVAKAEGETPEYMDPTKWISDKYIQQSVPTIWKSLEKYAKIKDNRVKFF